MSREKIKPWLTKKLGEVAYFQEGPGLRTFQFKPSGIRVINVANVQDGFLDLIETKYLDPKEIEKNYQHFLVNEGDMLLSTSGTIGRVARVKKEDLPLMLNTSVMRLRSLDENILLNQFLFYFLKTESFKRTLLSYKTGVAIFNVGPSHLKRIWITLPPLSIQHQIVERLDKIQKVQELNDKQIALAEELFQSLLDREIDPKGKSWEVKRLGEVVIELVNGFPSRPVLKDAGVPQFRPHNIGLDGTLVFEGIKFVPRKIKNIGNYFLKKDNVIFNNTNSIELVGKTAYIDKDYEIVFSNHLTRIKVNPSKVSGYYLATLLHLLYKRRKFQTLCTPWVNQAAVNNTALRKLKFFLPPLQTQRQIVEKLQAVQDYKKKLLEQKQKLKELFNSYLDKAMKGEL